MYPNQMQVAFSKISGVLKKIFNWNHSSYYIEKRHAYFSIYRKVNFLFYLFSIPDSSSLIVLQVVCLYFSNNITEAYLLSMVLLLHQTTFFITNLLLIQIS